MLAQLGFIFTSSDESGGSSGFGWSQVAAFGAVILIMAIMPKIIRRIRRERTALQRQELKSMEDRPNIRSQADKVLVDLADMSREINAQSDTKIRVLNKMVRDAESVLVRYEELIEREEKLVALRGASMSELPTKSNVSGTSISNQMKIKTPAVDSLEQSDIKKVVVERTQEKPAVSMQKSPESGVWQDTIGAKISKLHKQGCDVNDIARKTRVSVSEVTLILEMLRKKG